MTEYDTKESEVLKLLNSVNVAKREVEVVSGRSVAKATTITMYLFVYLHGRSVAKATTITMYLFVYLHVTYSYLQSYL